MADDRSTRREAAPAPVDAARTPPFDDAAEKAVLGAVLIDPAVVPTVATRLRVDDFYRESHREIFRAMLELDEINQPADPVTLQNRLRTNNRLREAGGLTYLTELATHAPGTANVPHHAEIVRAKAVQRQIISFAREAHEAAHEPVEDVRELVDKVAQQAFSIAVTGTRPDAEHVREVLSPAIRRVQELSRSSRRGLPTGIASGFHALDRKTSGWQNSDLVILAARPSMGKTAFALNILQNAARDSRAPAPGLFFSLEMSREQVAVRLLCSLARISIERFRSGDLSPQDFNRLFPAVAELSRTPLFISDRPAISVAELVRTARQYRHEHGIGLVVVDYLQLMSSGIVSRSANRVEQISEISRGLKTAAKELDIPIIALSQLSRGVENRPDKHPLLSDLRESGAIEQDADLILFLYREDYYQQIKGKAEGAVQPSPATLADATSETEVIIAKHRSGPTGTVKVRFHRAYTLFSNLEGDDPPAPTDADAPRDMGARDRAAPDYPAPPPAPDGTLPPRMDGFVAAEFEEREDGDVY